MRHQCRCRRRSRSVCARRSCPSPGCASGRSTATSCSRMASLMICSCAPRVLSAGLRALRRARNGRCLPSLRLLSPYRPYPLWPCSGTPFFVVTRPQSSQPFICLQSGTDQSRLPLRVPAPFSRASQGAPPGTGGRAAPSAYDRATMDATPLVEREGELDAVEELLAGVRAGAGGTLLIEGRAGIGKSSLLAAARGMAADVRVARARLRAGARVPARRAASS